MVWYSFLDPVLKPLLVLGLFWAVVILSFLITLIITVIYKYTTDQVLMKQLRTDLKSAQQEIKKHRDNPQKMMEINKRAMELNMKYMMQSFRSMIFTFIPIIILFGWMNATLAYEPVQPGIPFTVTVQTTPEFSGNITLVSEYLTILNEPNQQARDGSAQWTLQGDAGDYLLQFDVDGRSVVKEITISSEQYVTPQQRYSDPVIKEVKVQQEKRIALNLFGWKLGWLGTYIILSILFSMLLRKVLHVY